MTKYIFSKYLLFSCILVFSFFNSIHLYAQVDQPGQVWQWSVPVQGALESGHPRAYMWIPPNCSKVRGLVLAQNNMQEFSILENQEFRDSLASIGFGEVWYSPAFDLMYHATAGTKTVLLQSLADLATSSGYGEVKNVPFVPLGHSASSPAPFAYCADNPERALCGVSDDGTFPYDSANLFSSNEECSGTSDYIPQLVGIGEYEGGGDASTNLQKIMDRRHSYPHTPETFLPIAGEYHFATSQRRTNFIAYYIKKIAAIRLAVDATDSTLATLTPIDPTATGWLVDRWRKNMRPRYPRAPVGSYTGTMAKTGSAGEENFWCVDGDMAARIEDYENLYFRKTPTLLMYNQSNVQGVVGPQVAQNNNHVQVDLSFYPLNDSLDFELSSSFADTIPAMSTECSGWMSTTDSITGVVTNGKVGAKVGHPSNPGASEIIREIGPIGVLSRDTTTGITKMRMMMERGLNELMTNYVQYCIFSVAHPGDATYKASVLEADMYLTVNNTAGLVQTITFPQIANVPYNTTSIPLTATSNLGLPVGYYVIEGPAQLSGSNLVLTTIPPNAKYPIKVTVGAWQWGRSANLAAHTSGTGAPYAGQLVQTAQQVLNTFYITAPPLPVKLISFTGTLLDGKTNLNWKTGSETNLGSFEIEKSIDGNNWVAIGTVSAKGTASEYALTDATPVNGTNYYRLKMMDKDGAYEYSKVVSVYVAIDGLEIVKAGRLVNVTGGRPNSRLVVVIYNSMGQVVQVNQTRIPNVKKVSTYLNNLAAGVYIIHAATDEFVKSLKVIVN